MKEIKKVLVANRGVPAVRIMHTCRDLRIKTAAVYSTPDRLSSHVAMANKAIHIGDAPPRESYLNGEKIINAALAVSADAIHPGWGFLAENHKFAQDVIDAGLTWVGPPPKVIEAMGDKIESKKIATSIGIPVVPGIENVSTVEEIVDWMNKDKIDFPIMLKASAGGGGKGMVKVEETAGIAQALEQVQSEGMKSFGDNKVLVEKYIERGRHIEVQIVADNQGNVVHLFERECTIQRRNQKIIEEAPSPSLDHQLRQQFCNMAVRLMQKIGYASAGTVEFLFDSATRKYYFLEVNTRLQVEHGITELVTGVDIVRVMLDVAMGKPLAFQQYDIHPNRWALEARINAEDPKTFAPSFGSITRLQVPQGPGVRTSPGFDEGADIPPYYDSLIMLVMATGVNRKDAIKAMDRSISKNLRVEGVKTLSPLLLSIIRHPRFISGEFSTRFIEEHMDELIEKFIETDTEDEMLKVAEYVAEVSALGIPKWI